STAKKPFGEYVIDRTTDTALSNQEILKIRSLDNAIFDSGTFIGKEQIAINYRLFKPTQQKTMATYPLVVIYHGSGPSIGSDNKSQLGILQKLFAGPGI